MLPVADYRDREQHDLAMVTKLLEVEPDLVVLAGYMRIVAPALLKAFPWRVINLHPALLPAFPGTHSIADAVRYGVKVTGVTVHFVDPGVDTGPVIAQEAVRVENGDTVESLAARIHEVEHRHAAGGHPPVRGRKSQTTASGKPGRAGRLSELITRDRAGIETGGVEGGDCESRESSGFGIR